MPIHEQKTKPETLNFRVDRRLKTEFAHAADLENRPVSEVLRDLMSSYVQKHQRKHFDAEARRQSVLAANSPDETEVMRWIENVSDTEGWIWEEK